MSMNKKVEEIRKLKESTLDAARPHAVAKQRAGGKKTARERLELLCDPGSFLEFGQLAVAKDADKETPADGVICGIGKVNGRYVAVINYDYTVLGGSQGMRSHDKTEELTDIACEQGIPVVYLLEGGGARAQAVGDWMSYNKSPNMFIKQAKLSGWVPMIAGIFGPCYAGHAILASVCDVVIMVEGTSSMGVAGTPHVRMALSLDITLEELGGARMHNEVSGCADIMVQNEEECISKIKESLSYFPDNAKEMPPIKLCDDPVERREESLLDIVPDSETRPFDMYRIIRAIVDHGQILDIKGKWAKNIITCLARLNGLPVGIAANQPMVMAGVIDTLASEKFAHFIEMCDAFNIPIIFLGDSPGVMIGPEAERTGLVRRSAKIHYAIAHCTVPTIGVIIRRCYGLGGGIMGQRFIQHSVIIAWPTGIYGEMGLRGLIEITYRKEIAESKDPDRLRAELFQKLQSQMDVIASAKSFSTDDVIDPRDTRPVLIKLLEYFKHKEPHLPPKKHGIHPI